MSYRFCGSNCIYFDNLDPIPFCGVDGQDVHNGAYCSFDSASDKTLEDCLGGSYWRDSRMSQQDSRQLHLNMDSNENP